jgi:hypothetical protein
LFLQLYSLVVSFDFVKQRCSVGRRRCSVSLFLFFEGIEVKTEKWGRQAPDGCSR